MKRNIKFKCFEWYRIFNIRFHINGLLKFPKFGIEVWSFTGTTKLSSSIHLKPFWKIIIRLEAYLGTCQTSMVVYCENSSRHKLLTFQWPMFPSYRNQLVDLLCKSTDFLLYDGNISRWKVNFVIFTKSLHHRCLIGP